MQCSAAHYPLNDLVSQIVHQDFSEQNVQQNLSAKQCNSTFLHNAKEIFAQMLSLSVFLSIVLHKSKEEEIEAYLEKTHFRSFLTEILHYILSLQQRLVAVVVAVE